MEFVANFTTRHRHHHLHLTLRHRSPSISKPISSLSFSTQFPSLKLSSSSSPFKASFSSSSSPQTPNHHQKPSFSPLKTALIAAVTATAVLLSRFNPKPALAAVSTPPPPATVVSEKSKSVLKKSEVRSDQAEKNLELRLASNPKDIEALRNLMEIMLKGNKLKEALVLLDKLMILEPNDEDWPILKAYIHTKTGNYEASKKTFYGIISKNAFKIEAYHGLIMVASQKESEEDLIEAEERVKDGLEKAKFLKIKSSEREFNVLLAQVMVIKGDYDNALRIYEDLIKEKPKDFRPYLCQGIIFTLLKKDADAEASFKMYRSLVPKDHPHGEYFENNMMAAKLFVQEEGNNKTFSRR